MSGCIGLNRVEHMLLMKVVLVGHQYRAAEKLLLRSNTETSDDITNALCCKETM